MKQYCRYCFYMVCGDNNYCVNKDKFYSDNTIKHTNTCKDFNFTDIDALAENEKPYKPREKKEENENQIKLF